MQISLTPFIRLEPNASGRDFIVGDLHGSLYKLLAGLERIGFSEESDRLFCTGDLIDRGPDSLLTLTYLMGKPWFFATIGNHEAMLLTYFYRRESFIHGPLDFLRNGGHWADGLDQSESFDEVIDCISRMPLVYAVGGDRPFYMVHAQHTIQDHSCLTNKGWIEENADFLFWERTAAESAMYRLETTDFTSNAPENIPIYTGHTIVDSPKMLPNGMVMMDCGLYHNNEIYIFDHTNNKMLKESVLNKSEAVVG